ncbi:MAG TPA: transcription antitermination factor NusB [Lachnospiraceae bacterium]
MKRREIREHIFKLLFLKEFNMPEEMDEQLSMYFDGLEGLQEKEQSYMEGKYADACLKLEEIDKTLEETSKGWKVSRMSKVDLSILRLAVYEMNYDEEVPVKVAINEAVELSKRFGGEESASFVNGILGKIASNE